MLEAVLHIGLPKTGTSSIQNWAEANAESFKSKGLFFVPTLVYGHRLAVEFIDAEVKYNRQDIDDILRATTIHDVVSVFHALKHIEEIKKLFISSEYLYVVDKKKLADFFKDLKISIVDIVVFLRRQDILAASGYNQDVKALSYSDDIGGAEYSDVYDYDKTLDQWQRAFPKATISAYNFDKLVKDKTVLKSMAHELGVEGLYSPVDEDEFRVNEALCAEGVEIVRVANRLGCDNISEFVLSAQRNGLKGSRFYLPDGMGQAIFDIYYQSNKRLQKKYGEQFSDFTVFGNGAEGRNFANDFPVDYLVRLLSHAIGRINES